MKKLVLFLLPATMLVGCASADIQNNFSHVIGKPVDQVAARLGRPDAVRQADAARVVEWTYVRPNPYVVTIANGPTSGFLLPDSPRFIGSSEGKSSFTTVAFNSLNSFPKVSPLATASAPIKVSSPDYTVCKVSVSVDRTDIVRGYQYEGELNACWRASRRFSNKA